jgi:hemerythrin-like domain-containing protein
MRFEHQQIHAAAKALESAAHAFREHPGNDQLCDVRAHLYGLEALLRAHIAREELFLLPVLQPIESQRAQQEASGA